MVKSSTTLRGARTFENAKTSSRTFENLPLSQRQIWFLCLTFLNSSPTSLFVATLSFDICWLLWMSSDGNIHANTLNIICCEIWFSPEDCELLLVCAHSSSSPIRYQKDQLIYPNMQNHFFIQQDIKHIQHNETWHIRIGFTWHVLQYFVTLSLTIHIVWCDSRLVNSGVGVYVGQ